MTIPVLIILGILWAAVLVPPLIRAYSERRGGTMGDYSNTIGALKPSARTLKTMSRPTASLVNGSMHSTRASKASATKKRRRDVFNALLAAVVVTLILAIVLSNPAVWLIHVICDIAFGAYVYLLIQIKEQERLKTISGPRLRND